ncbi:hypothetical protein L9F63_006019 [Diploptera punctata]|uniref:Uncharacterized protein n=1 Tax=Diploptera punctata TaxID=6984 RepID=A0AAD7ZBR4_DIPPU|nr:hypothetical protein L9F63_006019 [Diploptera punctata]
MHLRGPFTECSLKKYDICPDAKKKAKSYDGCQKKKKTVFECPEKPQEKEKPKPSKKKKELDECDKEDDCSNVEPFKFKSGYSKSPMKCSSVNNTQHNLPPVRSYSDLTTNIPFKAKHSFRSSSYTDCQIQDLGVRTYSEDQKSKPKSKKSKYDTVPCPEDPDPPCRPKEGDVVSVKVCPIIDKHFIECPKPAVKVKPTCEQPLLYKKEEEKPPPPPPGICRGDHLVKTFVECPKPPPRKKGIICDGPYQPRIEPCFGQVQIKKGEKVSRKKCGVDPDDKTLLVLRRKRMKEENLECYYSDTDVCTVSPTIEPCEHPPQIKEVTCETVTNKLELKKDTSCRIPETTKKQDFCHRTECCPTNKDGAIEDLLMIIKSWFSFLKARECCPEPDTKRKQKLHVVPSCKSRQDTIGENNCSKQMKITRKEIECKKVPAPKPSFSECSKELLAPPKFTECNRPTAVNINSKSDIVKPGNSVCDMYLQKNKIKMSKKSCENIKLQQTDSLKSENAECKIPKQDLLQESTICQETSGEPNLFYRLLNKKSKLPECQEKDSCETQNEVMDKCKKIHSQVEKNVCEAPKEVQECEKNQSSSQNINVKQEKDHLIPVRIKQKNSVMSDIWSYCQNDIPAHSILKVPEPVHPKTNPKLDSPYLFESPVFQPNIEGECEENEEVKMELQPCSSGKVSQKETMAKQLATLETNSYLSNVDCIAYCINAYSISDLAMLNKDYFRIIHLWFENAGFQRDECDKVTKPPPKPGECDKVTKPPTKPDECDKVTKPPPKPGECDKVTKPPTKPDECDKVTKPPTKPDECKKEEKFTCPPLKRLIKKLLQGMQEKKHDENTPVDQKTPPKKIECKKQDEKPMIKEITSNEKQQKESSQSEVEAKSHPSKTEAISASKIPIFEISPQQKGSKTKEDIEARKKAFKVTQLSPIKNPPPLPPCDKIGSPPAEGKETSQEDYKCKILCPGDRKPDIKEKEQIPVCQQDKAPKTTCTEDKSPSQTCFEPSICPPKKRIVKKKGSVEESQKLGSQKTEIEAKQDSKKQCENKTTEVKQNQKEQSKTPISKTPAK